MNPSRNRKDGTGNPPPTAGAPELHPDRSHGGTVNPSRNRKDGTGNPPPTAGAPELHPDRSHGGTVNPSRNRKGGAGNPPPTAGAPELHPDRVYGSASKELPEETGSKQLGLTFGTPRQSSTLPVRGAISDGRPYRDTDPPDDLPEPDFWTSASETNGRPWPCQFSRATRSPGEPLRCPIQRSGHRGASSGIGIFRKIFQTPPGCHCHTVR